MKDIRDIVGAYGKALKNNLRAALATVVSVEGSSYRRPGARMLITEDGILTGAISGGCLEGDALKKALSAIHTQTKKLVTYDTADEDDAKFGVQLGCNGIVHILFEPIVEEQENNPINILKLLLSERTDGVVATLYSLNSKRQYGTIMHYKKGKSVGYNYTNLTAQLEIDAQEVLANRRSAFNTYTHDGEQMEGFIELIKPPISLVIAGAGNDAQPLAEIAYQLGWEVTVADGRPTHATHQRFPNVHKVIVSKPVPLLPQITIDDNTAFALMTHNYNYDTELLGLLLNTNARYIGTLGPKKKLIRMLDELDANTADNAKRIHGPIGLDIGAETAEEIAISIIAEIKSEFANATAGRLKEKSGPVHEHPKTLSA